MLKKYIDQAKILLIGDLAPEDVAMAQALYSRSSASMEDHYQKIREGERAGTSGKFMERYYVGYGDASIADCGSTTLAAENVSMLCAKAIQNSPLYSGQETSTRFLDMGHRDVVDPIESPESATVIDAWMTFYRAGLPRAEIEVRRRHPRRPGEDEALYDRAAAARAFDVMRGFLPAGCTTQVSWHTNLRQAGDHLAWLRAHPLAEVRGIADGWLDLLREAYPSTYSRLRWGLSSVGADDHAEARRRWTATMAAERTYLDPALPAGPAPTYPSTSFGADDHAEARRRWATMATDRIYPSTKVRPYQIWTSIDDAVLAAYARDLESRPRGAVLPHWMSDLGQVSARFNLDFGSFRDLQRHRNGVCRMPLLTADVGFHPWYISELDPEHAAEALALVETQSARIQAIDARPEDKQYLHAMGFEVPCRVTYGLPAAVYVMELRSGRAIHPTLREVVLAIAQRFRVLHPSVRLHLDEEPDDWWLRRGAQTIEEMRP